MRERRRGAPVQTDSPASLLPVHVLRDLSPRRARSQGSGQRTGQLRRRWQLRQSRLGRVSTQAANHMVFLCVHLRSGDRLHRSMPRRRSGSLAPDCSPHGSLSLHGNRLGCRCGRSTPTVDVPCIKRMQTWMLMCVALSASLPLSRRRGPGGQRAEWTSRLFPQCWSGLRLIVAPADDAGMTRWIGDTFESR
jgi:hypothetical protein